MKTKILLIGIALVSMVTLVNAQNVPSGRGTGKGAGKGSSWVDADKNGVCDRFEARSGQGRAGKGRGQGKGIGFQDTNKNGICDFRESSATK